MSFSKAELLQIQTLLEELDRKCFRMGFPPNDWPRPSCRDVLRRIKQEVILNG